MNTTSRATFRCAEPTTSLANELSTTPLDNPAVPSVRERMQERNRLRKGRCKETIALPSISKLLSDVPQPPAPGPPRSRPARISRSHRKPNANHRCNPTLVPAMPARPGLRSQASRLSSGSSPFRSKPGRTTSCCRCKIGNHLGNARPIAEGLTAPSFRIRHPPSPSPAVVPPTTKAPGTFTPQAGFDPAHQRHPAPERRSSHWRAQACPQIGGQQAVARPGAQRPGASGGSRSPPAGEAVVAEIPLHGRGKKGTTASSKSIYHGDEDGDHQ